MICKDCGFNCRHPLLGNTIVCGIKKSIPREDKEECESYVYNGPFIPEGCKIICEPKQEQSNEPLTQERMKVIIEDFLKRGKE